MIKKMMLLAGMALAAIAFAAPAAAQAEANWIHSSTGETIGGEGEATPFHAQSPITSVIGTLRTTANITLAGRVWNEGGMGVGVIDEKTAGVGTVNGVPGFLDCTVEVTLLTHVVGGNSVPWKLTLTTDEGPEAGTENATLDIENVTFLNHYNAGCQAAGTPATGGAEGTVTATLTNNPNGDVDLTFDKGDLTVTGSGGTVPVGLETPAPVTITGGAQVEQH